MSSLALLSELETSGWLQLPTTTTAAQYEALGAALGFYENKLKWAIGDYVIQGEALFGQEAYQLMESLGISEESRMQYVRVALAFPSSRRRAELSWSHHRAVYSRDERDALLEETIANGWTKRELEAHLRDDAPEPPVVVEQVIAAARQVFLRSSWTGEMFQVEFEEMNELGTALQVSHPSGATG